MLNLDVNIPSHVYYVISSVIHQADISETSIIKAAPDNDAARIRIKRLDNAVCIISLSFRSLNRLLAII